MSDEIDRQTFETRMKTLDLGVALEKTLPEPTLSLRADAGGTDSLPELHTLPELKIDERLERESTPDLEIVDVLGEGGMGVVRLARQVSLDREVAVKTVHDRESEAATEAFLREAYVCGYLEHPNIIPVHNVGRTDDGEPIIVMKRVEGTTWEKRLRDDQAPPSDLEREIEVLIEVANAVRFAHSRGIVHRDIKAENVMLGEFDEVYLVDWGLAVSLDDQRMLIPTAGEDEGLVGTPGFMAPEMARQDVEALDERTDVYLLGAMLHEVLTGRARHHGETLINILYEATQSEPVDYGEDVPGELADIANRACSRDPDDRFESAEAFRQALEDFLVHRNSVALSDSADERLQRLQQLTAADDPDERQIHDAYAECRFGYNQALQMWADNPAALQGLQQCLETMCRYHLECENLEAARACLLDLPEDNDELAREVDRLAERLEEQQQDIERLKEMERDLDLSTSSSKRSILMIVFGIIWTFTSLYGAIAHGGGQAADGEALESLMSSGFRNLAIASVGIFLFRKPIFANVANARLAWMFLTFQAALAGVRWSAWYLDAEILLARMGENALATLLLVAIGVSSDLRVCAMALLFVVLGAATILVPEYYPFARPVAVALTFFGFAWLWSPSQMENRIEL